MTDNFIFCHDIQPGYARFYSGDHVSVGPMSLESAFRQTKEMYFTWCGRFAGNMAVYMLFMLPHWLYCVVASLCFGLYVLLLEICIFGRYWREQISAGWTLAVAGMLWIGVPSFGEAFFWLSVGGQIALLGQALMFIPYRFALDRKFPCQTHGLFIKICASFLFLCLGIIASSLDYATSAALPPTALACVIWLFYRDKKFSLLLSCGMLGLFIGSALTLGAPGNYQRLQLTNDTSQLLYSQASWGERVMGWLAHLPGAALEQYVALILIAWSICALFKYYRRQWYRNIPSASLLFLLPALLTYGAYLFTAWPPARAFATCSVQLMVCAAIIFVAAERFSSHSLWRKFNFLRFIFCAYCLFLVFWEGAKFYDGHQIFVERENILHSASKNMREDIILLPPMPEELGDRYWSLGFSLQDISSNPNFWVNRAMAAHYGVRGVVLALPDITYGAPESRPDLEITFEKNRIRVNTIQSENLSSLHFYYYGDKALLKKLPYFLGQKIFHWLSEGKPNDYRNYLLPLLLARTDINLFGKNAGISQLFRMVDDNMIWLVEPGKSKYSFDLIPLLKAS